VTRSRRLAWLPARSFDFTDVDFAGAADQLAVAVQAQWAYESKALRIFSPYALAVSWLAADSAVAASWDSLVTWAESPLFEGRRSHLGFGYDRTGQRRTPPPHMWAAGPDGLAGSGDDLPDVLNRAPTGRLVVLGEPGAGKTVLMIRLVLQLLEPGRRQAGGPVPVLFSLASWNPASDLFDWLATQLAQDYPFLAVPISGMRRDFTLASWLLLEDRILPVLDGLDEIPDVARARAVHEMTWTITRPVVVTCRTQEYLAIARTAGIPLPWAAVQLLPVTADVVADYLRDSVLDEGQPSPWDEVIARLRISGPLNQALSTPLMVGLARDIYSLNRGPDPSELLELPSSESVQLRLLDAFTPAAFRRRRAIAWPSSVRAERWLTYLAAYLQAQETTDLAWWELRRAVPSFVAQLAGGFVAGLGVQAEDEVQPRAIRIHGLPGSIRGLSSRQLGIAVALGLGAGTIGELTSGLIGLASGVTAGLITGIAFSLPRIIGRPADPTGSPVTSIRRDRLVALAAGLAGAALGGLLGVLATKLMQQTIVGFAAGAALGLATGVTGTAWGRFQAARAWLALRGHLPWRLIRFLAHAHAIGVLRQNGSVYQFRHALLQEHLARQAHPATGSPQAPDT
jgi:hypothetical protein